MESKVTTWKASQGLPKPIPELDAGFFWTRVHVLHLPDEEISNDELERRMEVAVEYLRDAKSPTRFMQ